MNSELVQNRRFITPRSPQQSVTFLPRNLAHAANTWSFQKYRETRRANLRRRLSFVAGISRPAGFKPLKPNERTDRSVGIGADHLVPIPRSSAFQVVMLTVLLMNLTDPSQNAVLEPPGCREAEETTLAMPE